MDVRTYVFQIMRLSGKKKNEKNLSGNKTGFQILNCSLPVRSSKPFSRRKFLFFFFVFFLFLHGLQNADAYLLLEKLGIYTTNWVFFSYPCNTCLKKGLFPLLIFVYYKSVSRALSVLLYC